MDVKPKTHLEIKALFRTYTLLISGTFIANEWSDIYTFIDLIPGHPVETMADFQRAFSMPPPTTQLDNLNHFFWVSLLPAPNSVLRLHNAAEEHAEFELSEDEDGQATFWVMNWYQTTQISAQQLSSTAHEQNQRIQSSIPSTTTNNSLMLSSNVVMTRSPLTE